MHLSTYLLVCTSMYLSIERILRSKGVIMGLKARHPRREVASLERAFSRRLEYQCHIIMCDLLHSFHYCAPSYLYQERVRSVEQITSYSCTRIILTISCHEHDTTHVIKYLNFINISIHDPHFFR